MNAYAEYPVNLVAEQCCVAIRTVEHQICLADCVECEDNEDISQIGTYRIKLNTKLSIIRSLLKMCNKLKLSEKITLDLECVDLLWSND